jgi:hypothetical protein
MLALRTRFSLAIAVIIMSFAATPALSQLAPGSGTCVVLPGLAGGDSRAWGATHRGWYPLAVCGDAKIGGIWQAVVWVQEEPGAPWLIEALPPVDPLKPSRANDVVFDERDLVLVACGYAYDALDRQVPMQWTRSTTSPYEWTGTPLPTFLPDGDGEVLGILAGNSMAGGDGGPRVEWAVGTATVEVTPPAAAGSSSADIDSEPTLEPRAAVWKHTGPGGIMFAKILAPGGDYSGLSGYSFLRTTPDGVVRAVGSAVGPGGGPVPVVWESADSGTTWAQTSLPLPADLVAGEALAADDSGPDDVVAGYGEDLDGNRSALSWSYDPENMQWLVHQIGIASGYPLSEARGVRAVAGRSCAGTAINDLGTGTAAYWHESEGVVTFLTAVSVCGENPPVVDNLAVGTAIDDNERVVGWGTVEAPLPTTTTPAIPGQRAATPAFANATADTDTVAWIIVPTTPTAIGNTPSVGRVSLSAFPNPFHPDVRVAFRVPHATRTRLDVYDVRGRRVRTLMDGYAAGAGRVTWNGTNNDGVPVASGVYFLRLHTTTATVTRKVMMLR